MKDGFVKVAAGTPEIRVADCVFNGGQIVALMKQAAEEKHLSMVILMLTDVLKEGTQLIYVGDDEVIHQAFGVVPKENTLFLPGVMSRKKQVIPMLSALWG